jgi:GLPGLI family protein
MILRYVPLSLIVLVSFCKYGNAQNEVGGTVIYQRSIHYTFQATGKPEWDVYAKTLPKEGSFDNILYFTSEASLFLESEVEKEELSIAQQKAVYMANYGKAPSPDQKQVYYDFSRRDKIEVLEFMTRDFIVESEIQTVNWKLSGNRKKISGYICMEALMMSDGDTLVAWFAPEIPVSTGPSDYIGLPGLILAVEKNSVTIFLASSIEMINPSEDHLVKPSGGKALKKDEFDKIVEKKTEEYQKAMSNKDAWNKEP